MTESTRTWWGEEPQNILVRMPNWLGDLVMATPVLADLRLRFPNARLTAMCKKPIAQLLEHDQHIDELFAFTKPSGWISHLDREIVRPLRSSNYDLGVLLTNSLSSAWWFWRGGVRHRLGYPGHFRRFLLDKTPPYPQNIESQHLVVTYKSLLEPLGIPISSTDPYVHLTTEEVTHAKSLLQKHGWQPKETLIGINPGAAYGSAKCWLPDRFKELTLRLLGEPHQRILYFGDHSGAPLVNDICSELKSQRIINLAGKTTIRELAALIQQCNLLITNDSGPMHLAAAVGTPPLALFGSTSDVKTGPYKLGEVIHKRVACSPCYKRVCPIDFRCMKRIEVDEVYHKSQEMLEH